MKQLDIYDSSGEQLLTADLVAEIMGCKIGTIDSYLSRGQMPEPQGLSGRTRLWSKFVIDKWIASRSPNKIPLKLTSRLSWVRADGKRPITTEGKPASSTNENTWSSYQSVINSSAGDGFGIMLGDGIGAYDFDHVLDGEVLEPWVRDYINSISEPIIFIERSMSGNGLHVFVETKALKGYKKDRVEFYPRSRFIRMTGKFYKI